MVIENIAQPSMTSHAGKVRRSRFGLNFFSFDVRGKCNDHVFHTPITLRLRILNSERARVKLRFETRLDARTTTSLSLGVTSPIDGSDLLRCLFSSHPLKEYVYAIQKT